MSNNLVRQIVKAGGSFFVGASIAIGTLCPIVLSSSRVLADSYQQGIPTVAASELQTLANQGINPKTIAFAPNGGWVILYNNNEAAWNNIPPDAANEILALNKQGSTINTIAFTPNGEWVIIFDGNGYDPSANFPQDVLAEIATLNKQGSTINTIAFTPNGEWVIIFDGNGYDPSANFPQDVLAEIATLNKRGSTINSVAFTPDGGWVTLYNDGDTAHGYAYRGIPQGALNAIAKANSSSAHNILTNIAFTPSNGWALLYQVDEQALLNDEEEGLFASEFL